MNKINRIGNLYGFDGGSYAGNVYSVIGLAPTIKPFGGGRREPLILIYEEDNTFEHDKRRLSQDDLFENG